MARQKLGQHFLSNGGILDRIVASASEAGTALVVEIGPGKGALTAKLLERFERVVAVELDGDLVEYLRERWRGEPRLEVIESSALNVDWAAWGAGVLVGNLPYYVATAIISGYLLKPGSLTPGVFMVQKEVANRITAQPGSRDYGYLSVLCQYLGVAEYLFTVPPGAFKPPPKVESAVVRLTPGGGQAEKIPDTQGFLGFVSACFRQKRKMLRNNLSGRFSPETLTGHSEMNLRAEQLSISDFTRLYRILTESEKQHLCQTKTHQTKTQQKDSGGLRGDLLV